MYDSKERKGFPQTYLEQVVNTPGQDDDVVDI